jgi:hypothetical protein
VGTLYEDLCTLMILSCSVLIRMRNISDKSCTENQNTHFVFNTFSFRKLFRLWDNVEKCGTAGQATDDHTMRRMRFACWLNKATDTHSEYIILIAFSHQQWLPKGTYIFTHTLSVFYRLQASQLCSFFVEITQLGTASHIWAHTYTWRVNKIRRKQSLVICPQWRAHCHEYEMLK